MVLVCYNGTVQSVAVDSFIFQRLKGSPVGIFEGADLANDQVSSGCNSVLLGFLQLRDSLEVICNTFQRRFASFVVLISCNDVVF